MSLATLNDSSDRLKVHQALDEVNLHIGIHIADNLRVKPALALIYPVDRWFKSIHSSSTNPLSSKDFDSSKSSCIDLSIPSLIRTSSKGYIGSVSRSKTVRPSKSSLPPLLAPPPLVRQGSKSYLKLKEEDFPKIDLPIPPLVRQASRSYAQLKSLDFSQNPK